MRRFVLGWKMLGLERSLGSRIVTYADDLVILCRRGKAEEALRQLRMIMGRLKLMVNEEKTRICKVPEGEFDFLGYTFGRWAGESASGKRGDLLFRNIDLKGFCQHQHRGCHAHTCVTRHTSCCSGASRLERRDVGAGSRVQGYR